MKANFTRIDHLFYLRDDLSVGDGTAQTMTFEQFESAANIGPFNGFANENLGGFGFWPDGVNDYLQITQPLLDWVAQNNHVLDFGSHHRPLYNDVTQYLLNTPAQTATVVLAIEPADSNNLPTWNLLATDPNGAFPAQAMLTALIAELTAIKSQIAQAGKSLTVIIRFASEMNDPGNPYGPKSDVSQPMFFQSCYQRLRQMFNPNGAVNFPFCFSPALRADLPWQNIAHYYPGDQVVDFVSGTWYVHGQGQFQASTANMRSYFASYASNGLPRGLDEVGGVDDNFLNCDTVLPQMIGQIESFDRGLSYLTLFINAAGAGNRWGQGAKLGWVPTQ